MEIVQEKSEKEEKLSQIPSVPKKYGEHYPPQGWVVAKMMQSLKCNRKIKKGGYS